jgi:hypothetical protein
LQYCPSDWKQPHRPILKQADVYTSMRAPLDSGHHALGHHTRHNLSFEGTTAEYIWGWEVKIILL